MNRAIKIVAAVAIVLAVPKIVQKIMLPDPKAAVAAQMNSVVAEANRGLPRKIDSVTTLTKAEFDNNVYRIHYTMDRGANVDPSRQQTYQSLAVKQICGSNMKLILDNRITIEFLYTFNPDGLADQHMTVAVPPGSCG